MARARLAFVTQALSQQKRRVQAPKLA